MLLMNQFWFQKFDVGVSVDSMHLYATIMINVKIIDKIVILANSDNKNFSCVEK
jgi:hypothetical protein